MPETLTHIEPRTGGGDLAPPDRGEGFGGGGGEGGVAPGDTARIGLWVLLGSLTMLFAAFTSAYLVRRAGTDWVPLDVPPILWPNTLVLLASSVTMELARRRYWAARPLAFRRWTLATFVLGAAFLAGQLWAWRALAAQGIFLDSHPHSSFFYVLTGVHGVHLLAGLAALGALLVRSWRHRLVPGRSVAPSLCATYWHFVDVVWLYLFAVLFLW